MSMISQLYAMSLMFTAPMMMNQRNSDERKDAIRKEWRETMNLPRKAKKKRRKELLIDWHFEQMNTMPTFSW